MKRMVKRCIGIDIRERQVHAVQVSSDKDGFCIEKVFSAPRRRSGDRTAEILDALTHEYGFDRRAGAAMAVADEALFYRNIEKGNAETLAQEGQPDWQNEFPLPFDSLITDGCSYHPLPDHGETYLLTATDPAALERQLEPFDQAKLTVDRADAPIFAVLATATVNHPQALAEQALIVYVNDSHLLMAVTKRLDVVMIRSLPWPADACQERLAPRQSSLLREIEMTWRAAMGDIIPGGTSILVAGRTGGDHDALEAMETDLLCKIVIIDPFAEVACPDGAARRPELLVAEGLALRGLEATEGSGVNFIAAYRNRFKKKSNPRNHLVFTLILLAGIALVCATRLFVKLHLLESQNSRVEERIRTTFQERIPGETGIVAPLAQIEAALTALRQEAADIPATGAGRSDPLDILDILGGNTPINMQLEIRRFAFVDGMVSLVAGCASEEAARQWQQCLGGLEKFSRADIENLKVNNQNGRVSFDMELSLSESH